MKQTNSLQSVLDNKKADWAANASDDVKRIYTEGIEAVEKTGIINSAKQIGDKAPNFILQNALGEQVSLSDYLKKGPVVLTWYRGGWCPYCNLTLNRSQEELPNITALGANLLALTPELPDKSLSTKEKHQLQFEVLSDVANEVARSYGIVFKLTDDVSGVYKEHFDLKAFNGDDSDELPLAATYIIDQQGIIKYALLDAEYRNRAEPEEITTALKNL
ncbi:peroxiredoxin-like family protein [Chondrinema litorale]|uniref:peroxiredoxin-like family protein n=1 Tax=Chondrinema litorale TaxID=2994555 RepID=UPI002543C067|nr:peroxiredoxin-like family protein [Chondrinema litorale]UZR97486.1 peroxiredoxin-like family protein [Chondrinema litorale]